MSRILVVDDEAIYCEQLEELLTQAGHDVRTALGRAAALQICEAFAPDLLVIDWLLKEQAIGLDVAAEIQQQHPRAAAIIITGLLDPEIKDRARTAGVHSVVEKPFGVSEILDAVQSALSASSSD